MKELITITVLSALIGFLMQPTFQRRYCAVSNKKMLINTMVYPDSYEAVSFGTLDSLLERR